MTKNKEQKKQGVWVRSKGFVIGIIKKINKKWILENRVIISVFAGLFSILLLLLLLLLQCHSCILKNNKNLCYFLAAVVVLSAFFLFLWFFKNYDTREKLGEWILKNRKKNLVFAGFCSILLLLLLLLLQCSFCILEGNKILDYFLTAVVGLPVFFLLWFFRTHDTRESIEKAEENIKQAKLFNYLENLASSEGMKVDLGVTQLIKLSEQEKKDLSLNEEIKLAFIKRLSYPPPINETKKNEPHLFYGQEIIKWLVEREDKDLSFTNLNLDYQSFDRIKGDCLNFFLKKVRPPEKKDSLQTKIEISFRYADLQNSEGTDLQGVNLEFANLEGATLFRTILKEAKLKGVNLKGADLEFVNLEKADLWFAKLEGANLEGSYLQGVNLESADLRKADLRKADLRKANLQGANLQGVTYNVEILNRIETKFPSNFDPNEAGMICIGNRKSAAKINLKNADLRNMNLIGADLRKANLQGANLEGTNLRHANLEEADLKGATLQGADLREANLKEATYNDKTNFPPDFDPTEAGMKTKKRVFPLK